nr:MAG TPA: tail completion protein [Caudoviricetes sp.]
MYPYIVYSNVSNSKKMASGKVYKKLPYYQISFFTLGTERDLSVIEEALQNAGIPYSDFTGIQGDENDETVTNYYTYVRCVENGQ